MCDEKPNFSKNLKQFLDYFCYKNIDDGQKDRIDLYSCFFMVNKSKILKVFVKHLRYLI